MIMIKKFSLLLTVLWISHTYAQKINYVVLFPNFAHHEANISLAASGIPAGKATFRMSRSSPGRYATHEFGKNVYEVKAFDQSGNSVPIIRVDGESMTPTLNHGDDIMVDHRDNMNRLRDGIYVLRLDGVLLVKRVATGMRRGEFSILSDNNLYPSWMNVDPALVTIVGRVVWSGRIHR